MPADSLSVALVLTETFPLNNSQLRCHWNAPTMTDKKRWERRSIAVITFDGKCTDQQICTSSTPLILYGIMRFWNVIGSFEPCMPLFSCLWTKQANSGSRYKGKALNSLWHLLRFVKWFWNEYWTHHINEQCWTWLNAAETCHVSRMFKRDWGDC